MEFMSTELSRAIDDIVKRMFWMNRVWDNIKDNMSVNWAMVTASERCHLRIAHEFPLIADTYSDIKDAFNVRTYYFETPQDTAEYTNLLQAFQRALDELVITRDAVVNAINIAQQEGNVNIKVLLEKNLTELTPMIKQHIILRDKAAQYGNSYPEFDSQIDFFFILGKKE